MNKSSFNTQQMENPAPITDHGIHTVLCACPDFGLGKDPSSRLSELQMALKQPYARYRDLPDKIDGVNWIFSIEASVDQFCAVGIGYTKKEAKRRASTALLQKMGYEVPEKDLLDATQTPVNRSLQNMSKDAAPSASRRDKASVHIGPDFGLGKDPSSRLSELQMLRNEKYAVYRTLQEKMVNNICVFTIEASLNQFTATGSAFTKKEAKRRASTALLFKMGFTVPKEEQPMENGLQKQVTPPEEAAVMEKATERYSREEQNLLGATGDSETNSESAESLVDIIIPQDVKILEKTQLPEDPSEQEGLDEVTEITEAKEILPDQSVENITGTSGDTETGIEIQNPEEPPFPKDTTSDGHQILEEMLGIALASPLWALTLEDETAQKPTEIKSLEGPGDDTDEALTAEETLGDSLMDAEYAGDAQSPLLWSNSDFETSFTSEDLHSNCADKLRFDGNSKISQSPLLWSEFRWLDGRINTFLHLMEVPEGESVAEISEAPADSSSEGHQSPSETQSPEQGGILDESINSESAESLAETLIPEDLEILEETRLPEDSTEQEGLEEVTEITEAGEILPDQAVKNIFVTSGIYNPCPKDTPSDGHQILEEMLNLAITSPLWAETLEYEDEYHRTEELHIDSEIPEASRTYDSAENISEDSFQSPEEHTCPGKICSEGHQSPSETQSPEQGGILDESINSESAESLAETLIPEDLEILEETRLPEDSTEQDGLEEVTEITEAGEILPDQAVENIFVTSGIYNPCPKDTPSDGHRILEEMLNLAITSPLWAETLKDEDEDHRTEELRIDSEIPEASRTYDSMENISKDSYQSPEENTCPGETCSEGHQNHDQSHDPEPANPVETKVVDGPREEEHFAEKLLAVPEYTEDFETVPERTAESFVIWIMMKKIFKNEPAHLRSYRDTLVDLLEKAALDHFVIPEGVRIKSKDVHKLGKAAARDLMYEYGGSFKVLLAAVGTNTMEFQEDAVKHLNIRLNAYKNRPKSGLKRFFSKWDKPYYY